MSENDSRFLLTTSAMQIAVDKKSGAVAMLGEDGAPIIAESDPLTQKMGSTPDLDGAVQQRFRLEGSQGIYGLGQHQTGVLDFIGTTTRLQQANTDVGVPVLVSTRGYGLFWNNPAVTDVDVDVPQAREQIVFRSQAGKGIDYFLFAGPDVDDIIGAYRDLTGQAPLMARWTWGLWQSKERYKSQAELLGVAAEYRRLGIPLDAVVQDWQYWKPGAWGSQLMDPARYPDPKKMLASLHDQHVHSIVSVWPRFDLDLDTTKELDRAGALYPETYNNVYPAGRGRWYDAFSKNGRSLYWKQISARLGVNGFDGYWLDGSEAELGGAWGQMRDVTTETGPGAEVYNAYPLMHTAAVHDGMRADYPAKRPIILTRSAWAGQQRNAAITWSGDVAGSWPVFRKQIPAGVNFSMSGIPYWSVDIGGFFGDNPADIGYQELFTRWLQSAVFNPMFRIHGTGAGKEVYSFPEAARAPLLSAIALRYRLLPYLYAQSWQVTDRGASFLYPVGMRFRDDMDARDLPDEYMFGRSILISPVVQKAATSREVYLPSGTDWYDFWTGERIRGGQRISVAAPIDRLPVHVAAGTILPLGSPVQYADASPNLPVELRIYRGADGRFTLYDDAGDGQGWRRGERATIELSLDDKAGTLTIGPRRGRYPGMAQSRIFRVVVVAPKSGTGLSEAEGQEVRYHGRSLRVELDRKL
jgi:alpha-D-xyloside xylohydrolase